MFNQTLLPKEDCKDEMRNIVFLTYHGIGHFNACFKIAKILQAEYNIVFAGFGFFKKYTEAQGFAFYTLQTVPFALGFEQWLNATEKKKNIYFHSLKDRWTQRLYKLREIQLHQLLAEVKPQYILIDSLQSTDFIVIYPYAKMHSIRIAFIQTMLPQIVRRGCPPINSLIFPDDRKGIKKAVAWFYVNRFAKLSVASVKFLGKSNPLMIRKRMRLNQVNPTYQSTEITPLSIPFRNIAEFILAPREFDFPKNANSDFGHYVGFMLDEQRKEVFDIRYPEVRERLKTNTDKLVYCSFGTVKGEDTKAVDSFIQKLIKVVSNTRYVLVVSMQNSQHSTFNHVPPDNVHFLGIAPQLEILSRASLFITHGGLNSIKEAVCACVPMLVYPLNLQLDQKGNSTRVVFHQLGLRGDLQKESEKGIYEKMAELLENPVYKLKIRELKATDSTYTSEKFMELFDTIEPLT